VRGGTAQETLATLLDSMVGLRWLCFDWTMAADRREACGGFQCTKRGHRGWVFIWDDLDVRRKESSIKILLVLIPLTKILCLVLQGGNLGSVTF
jgi:hypothetical protein